MVVGVREINQNDLPSSSWVNTTLQYTHGYGMVMSPANVATDNGDPEFAVGGVPPVSNSGLPTITQPSVYFGLNNCRVRGGQHQTARDELPAHQRDQRRDPLRGRRRRAALELLRQAMFAVRFSDFNLLISNQITDQSRLMFDRGVQARVSKAAPFLNLDSDPYPVLSTGRSTGSRTPIPPPTTIPMPRTPTPARSRLQRAQPELQLRAQFGEGARSTPTRAR